jgi:PPK2 family polyphosphate:nucleotide phosphotransferase
MAKIDKLAQGFCIKRGDEFRIKDIDPASTEGIASEQAAQERIKANLEKLRDCQKKLYAQEQWAVLLILQGMDAAGKDSLIRHVMSGVNPQGCEVVSFKLPSDEELRHTFLWRATCKLPERGKIGIFNRSYYEEVLVPRVHPKTLANEHLPERLISKRIWRDRCEDICAFERHLARNGTVVRKFFLHVSRREQKQRFLSRIEKPDKNWKFSEQDVKDREYWSQFMDAYEKAIRNTATIDAPWYVVPADHKWYTQLVVAAAIIDTLNELNVAFPKVSAGKRRELATSRTSLEGE